MAQQFAIQGEEDIVRIRQAARARARGLGLSLIDQTKLVTAASELARNTLDHGGGGACRLEEVHRQEQLGLKIVFEDRGPGIPNLDQALHDGFTTVGGLGLGLGGSRRLVHEFEIDSRPGQGTRVEIVCWKR